MESLALTVALIIFLMFASGFIALLLTFKRTKALSNVTVNPLQRILSVFLAIISLAIGLQISTQVDSLGAKLIGGFGVLTALTAFYRVFKK